MVTLLRGLEGRLFVVELDESFPCRRALDEDYGYTGPSEKIPHVCADEPESQLYKGCSKP